MGARVERVGVGGETHHLHPKHGHNNAAYRKRPVEEAPARLTENNHHINVPALQPSVRRKTRVVVKSPFMP